MQATINDVFLFYRLLFHVNTPQRWRKCLLCEKNDIKTGLGENDDDDDTTEKRPELKIITPLRKTILF